MSRRDNRENTEDLQQAGRNTLTEKNLGTIHILHPSCLFSLYTCNWKWLTRLEKVWLLWCGSQEQAVYGPLGRMRGKALLDFPVCRLCFLITCTRSLRTGRIPHAS